MIYWAPFLHFYQPPTQFHAILQKICNESYRPLLKMLTAQRNAKVTINICGVLTEMLNNHGGDDILCSIEQLANSGKLEFVESAKYHPILPLIPSTEIRRQIELNHKTNSSFFGMAYKVRGFFAPEMCYSDKLASIVSSVGYEWLLLAGVACRGIWPFSEIYKISLGKNKLITFYRDDILSNKISFKSIDSKGFISELLALSKGRKDIYVITAMDAETFGHHIQNWEKLFLSEVYKTIDKNAGIKQKAADIGKIKIVTISELLALFPIKLSKPPLPSSWSTSKEDIQKENYYLLWKDSSNSIHRLQWEHIDICFELVRTAKKVMDSKESRDFVDIARLVMDKAIHSCQFWWANKGRRIWNINMVNKGLILQEEALLNAYKAILVSNCDENIKKNNYNNVVAARDISNRIRDYLLEIRNIGGH